MHKPGFKLHARILHHLFGVATSGVIKEPLWDTATVPGGSSAFPSNSAWLQQRLSQLLQHSFPNLRPQQIEVCSAPYTMRASTGDRRHGWSHLEEMWVWVAPAAQLGQG